MSRSTAPEHRRVWLLALTLLGLLASEVASADPEQDYVLQCLGCHQSDGSGHPPDVPDFRGRLGYLLSVPGGRAYLTQVPGVAQALLDDTRLAALLNWTLAEFAGASAPADFERYDAAYLARHRHNPPPDIDAARAHFDELIEELIAQRGGK